MIKQIKKEYPCSVLQQDSILPSLSSNSRPPEVKTEIDDFEGLFVGYGSRETAYPYRQQNQYTPETPRQINIAVLENDMLYAEFLVDFGGRLWKLYDKQNKKDILYTNDVIRMRNLSVRNAWFSGGVEWNCGVIGHSPFTCKRMYCAQVQGADGEEVLRFYEFERVRSVYYQIDFWLEDNKLYSRVHICNPNSEAVPMYWWSNMASPEYPGGRVAVYAKEAYNNSDGMGIKKSEIPFDHGIDVSYPENIAETIDYFYNVPQSANKFIANVDKNGFGLLQMSSNSLKGRKLFSWGHKAGSAHWQKRLTKSAGWYVEIQAGLGKTQYECIPMPPKTHWDFMECYTLANIGAKAVNLPYPDFVEAVNRQVNACAPSTELDAACRKTLRTVARQTGKLLFRGSGYGWLYEQLGGNCPEHLQFHPAEDVAMWQEQLGQKEPGRSVDFAYGSLHETALEQRKNTLDWRIPYQLSLLAFDKRDYEKAKQYVQEAFLLENNLYLNHLYTFILYCINDSRYLHYAEKTLKMGADDYSVCEQILKLLSDGEAYESLKRCYSLCSQQIKQQDRLKMYLSYAYLKTGDVEKARELLYEDGGLNIIDYREGEKFLDTLYREIEHRISGTPIEKITVPEQFDYNVAKQVHENE